MASCYWLQRESHPLGSCPDAPAASDGSRALPASTLLLPVGVSIIMPAAGQHLPGATRFTRKGLARLLLYAETVFAASTLHGSEQKLLWWECI